MRVFCAAIFAIAVLLASANGRPKLNRERRVRSLEHYRDIEEPDLDSGYNNDRLRAEEIDELERSRINKKHFNYERGTNNIHQEFSPTFDQGYHHRLNIDVGNNPNDYNFHDITLTDNYKDLIPKKSEFHRRKYADDVEQVVKSPSYLGSYKPRKDNEIGHLSQDEWSNEEIENEFSNQDENQVTHMDEEFEEDSDEDSDDHRHDDSDEDFDEDSDEESDEESDEDFDEESDEDFDEESDEGSDEESDENPDEESDEGSYEESDENDVGQKWSDETDESQKVKNDSPWEDNGRKDAEERFDGAGVINPRVNVNPTLNQRSDPGNSFSQVHPAVQNPRWNINSNVEQNRRSSRLDQCISLCGYLKRVNDETKAEINALCDCRV